MKIISAVRHSGKTYHSKSLGFADCDEIIANKIGWPKHFDKKEFSDKIYACPHIEEHQVAVSFSQDSWQVLDLW